MSASLIWVCVFTGIIHATEALVYAFRLAGIRTRHLAISLSLFTSLLLIARLSNMLQAPVLGNMVDQTLLTNASIIKLGHTFRVIIGVAGLGAGIGCLLTPLMIPLFQRAIVEFQAQGSVIRLLLSSAIWPRLSDFKAYTMLPKQLSVLGRIKTLPKGFILLNILVTAVYAIGVLCSLYAGAMLPEFRATAIQLSGLINGIATILLTVFVDPALARLTDQIMLGTRSVADIHAAIIWLLLGRLIGIIILAQLLFWPFSLYLTEVTRWLVSL